MQNIDQVRDIPEGNYVRTYKYVYMVRLIKKSKFCTVPTCNTYILLICT